MTATLTNVMYRCRLAHRPQQRVGNPLQQVVFRLLALNLPAKANAAVSEPTTGRHKAASPDNVTGTYPHGDLRADRIGRNPARLDDSRQPDAVRRGKLNGKDLLQKESSPTATETRRHQRGQANLAKNFLNCAGYVLQEAGLAPGHRITQTSHKPKVSPCETNKFSAPEKMAQPSSVSFSLTRDTQLSNQKSLKRLSKKPIASAPKNNTNITHPAKTGTQKPPLPVGEGWGEGETEMQNPTSPVPTTPEPPRHDCYIDQHGNCPAADTELCDLHCPYRDEN